MTRDVRIIGAPTDYGTDRRGVDMGPSAIRYAGLAEQLEAAGVACRDHGDVPAPHAEENRHAVRSGVEARYLDEIREVTSRLAQEVSTAVEDGAFPLVLGGDHSVAIGTLAGVTRDRDVGIVWFDAHGDFNTPSTTPSGNVHGMALAAILGRGEFADLEWAHSPNVREENVAWVGLRSLDDEERVAVRESDATAFTVADIDERGITPVAEDALAVATDGVDDLHVSLDLDWLDPTHAPGVGTPVRGGVSYREAHSALELVARSGAMASLELVEVNPVLDDRNTTAELATELAGSALGKRIL